MKKQASRLTEFCQTRLGNSLRAVGVYSANNIEMIFVRDDLNEKYSGDILNNFISTPQEIKHNFQLIDEGMGEPEASLHLLEAGLIVQLHYPSEGLIFISMEQDVGRNFTRFIRECRNQISQATD
ncbi:DUF7522 family protein [Halorubrum salinum]|uniref:DUF7522 family protein n=1 Tax=Halorubrum salinum TaxID=767517 RepID=UPI0021119068|nr:hypothetical protein [Halorubrum salinum]